MGTLGPRRRSPRLPAGFAGEQHPGPVRHDGPHRRCGARAGRAGLLRQHQPERLDLSGSWEVSAGVNPANLERAIELILSELRRFVTEALPPEELADSQANYIGRLPLSLESNAGVAGALLNLERFQLGLDYYRRYPELVRSVTLDQVLEAARRYLDPERMVIVSSGPELPE